MDRFSSSKLAGVSIAASICTITLKLLAFFLTNSVSLLSDALESFVNLIAATITFFMVRLSLKPADETHPYGHGKAEYISSVAEGFFIIVAAGAIIFTAVQRLLNPISLDKPGLGLLFSIVASLINLGVGLVLIKNGKKRHSLALEADGHHLMTDVYTTAGVLVGLIIVYATRLYILDPIIAIIVGLNIISAGFSIMQKSLSGFMDSSIDKEYLDFVKSTFAEYKSQKIEFHGMRTRQSGSRKFISFHMLVPGAWSVTQAHSLAEEVEKKIRTSIPQVTITIHIEPLEDPVSWEDTELDRK
ncbi:MAG: cation diffusion facilitator family transporter [Candidatus Roizmanbacteria bacterium]|nr:cation diffusion facilitator family transporter [Candidatus Roizmanbacteria bacterium]